MNVKELWAYRDAVIAVHRALDDLVEYEAKIYSPGGARCNGMPFDPTGDNDRLAPIAEKHEELIRKLEEAKLEAHRAYVMLENFSEHLTEDEREVLDLRYRKCYTMRELETNMHRCERSLRYIIKQIKIKFAPFCT